MRPRPRLAGLSLLLLGGAAALVLLAVLLPQPVPPGADPGNHLYQGRLVLEGRAADVRYPPVFPLLMAGLWTLAGGDLLAAAGLLKAVPPLLMLAVGFGAHRATAALDAPAPAPALAFALAAANPYLWFGLMWGGYPQILALALALLALAAYGRWRLAGGPAWPFPALVAAAFLVNPYPPFFVLLAVGGMALADARLRPDRAGVLRMAPLLAVATVPVLAVYVPLALALKTASPVAEAGLAGTLLAMPLQALPQAGHLALPVLAGAAGLALGGARVRRSWGAALAAVLGGAVLLQVLTFMNLSGRALYTAAALTAPAGAHGLVLAARRGGNALWPGRDGLRPGAGRPGSHAGRPWRVRLRSAPRSAAALGIAGAVVVASVAAAGALGARDAAFYMPLGDEFLAVAGDLRSGDPHEAQDRGDLAVLGDRPVIDAWWLRAATMRDVWIAGEPGFQLFAGDLDRLRFATALAEGRAAVVRDGALAATGGCTGAGLSIVAVTTFVAFPALRLPDADLAVVEDGGLHPVPSAAWRTRIEDPTREGGTGAVVERAEVGNATVARRIAPGPDGFVIEVRAEGGGATGAGEPAPEGLDLVLRAPPGGSWRGLGPTAAGFAGEAARTEFFTGRDLVVDVGGLNATVGLTMDPADRWAHLRVDGDGTGPPGVRLHVRLEGAGDGTARVLAPADALVRQGVDLVYVRDPAPRLAERLALDPALSPSPSPGSAGSVRVFDLAGGRLGDPCPA